MVREIDSTHASMGPATFEEEADGNVSIEVKRTMATPDYHIMYLKWLLSQAQRVKKAK